MRLLNNMRDALCRSPGGLTLQLIVIDNASRDSSVETLRKALSHASLIFNQIEVGFGRANNQAIQIRFPGEAISCF